MRLKFRELQVQLGSIKSEKFNGVSLFSSDSSTSMTVYTSTNGSVVLRNLDNLDYPAGILSTVAAVRKLGCNDWQDVCSMDNSNTRYKCNQL